MVETSIFIQATSIGKINAKEQLTYPWDGNLPSIKLVYQKPQVEGNKIIISWNLF